MGDEIMRHAIVACLAFGLSVPAPALALTLTGTVDDTDPLWNRPIGGGPSISSLGPVNYETHIFTVPITAAYDILSTQTSDGYIHLYENAFDPAMQLQNLIAGDDGAGGIGTSEILGVALSAGTTYTLVTSGFSASTPSFGYTNTVDGEAVVPLPPTMALMGAFGALVFFRRSGRAPA